jgi:hypothetical protein
MRQARADGVVVERDGTKVVVERSVVDAAVPGDQLMALVADAMQRLNAVFAEVGKAYVQAAKQLYAMVEPTMGPLLRALEAHERERRAYGRWGEQWMEKSLMDDRRMFRHVEAGTSRPWRLVPNDQLRMQVWRQWGGRPSSSRSASKSTRG